MPSKKNINILLTSVGRRSYLANYFMDALGDSGELHVANSTALTPVFSVVEHHVVTPMIYDPTYVPFLLQYCKEHNITALISLFDVDLPVLAKNKEKFEQIGTRVIVSSYDVIHICNDKWLTYLFCQKNGLAVPKTYINIDDVFNALNSGELSFPLIIKPRWGMGSISILEVNNLLELKVLYAKVEHDIMDTYLKYESAGNEGKTVIVQEKLVGDEYGLDVINDLEGSYQNTIIKKKYAMRAGETDCAETVSNSKLKCVGECLGQLLHHIANLDVDIFLVNGEPFVLEMNARFGGGYPFSHMAGVNLPLAIVLWIQGLSVKSSLLSADVGIISHKDINLVKI